MKELYDLILNMVQQVGQPHQRHEQAPDKVQNQAVLIITGSMKCTPIKDVENATAIESLSERRDIKIVIQTKKFKYLSNYQMKQRMEGLTKSHLKHRQFHPSK